MMVKDAVTASEQLKLRVMVQEQKEKRKNTSEDDQFISRTLGDDRSN